MIQLKRHLFIVMISFLGIIGLICTYSKPLNSPAIRSDGMGYYLYLPAVFIYHDISLQRIAESHFNGRIPVWTGATLWKDTRNYLIKYPIGEALLMMPFFFVGWIFSLFTSFISVTKTTVSGFSFPFQCAAAVSGLFYVTAGLAMLRVILQRYFKQNTVLLVLIGLFFGTNLFHYATYDSVFSHAYSFFLFVSFLYLVEHVYSGNSPGYFIAVGAVAGLILVTRPTNVLWLIFGIFFGIRSFHDLRGRFCFFKRHGKKSLLVLLPFFGIVAIQLLYWKTITGSFFVYSYGNEHMNFTHPEILNVLFSVRKGLFFWSPVLLSVFPGLWYAKTKAADYFVPILIFFPLNVYIISCWDQWWYGGSFGNRAFVESMPMFAICLCSFYEGIPSIVGKKILLSAIMICIILSMWLMCGYWGGTIPFDNATWKNIITVFLIFK